MRLSVLWCVVAASLVLPASSLGIRQTTQPGTTLRVYVILTDKGISYTMFDEISTGGQTGLVPARGGGVRGQVAIFSVRNTGKLPHNFGVLGKKTGTLSSGRKSVFAVALTRRGVFPFASTLDKGKPAFHGVFTVR